MKYQRLKSIDGSGTIMRYYDVNGEALCNCFYGVKDNKASKIVGAVGADVELIGFSHGGDNVAKGLLFLDINPAIVYMGILEEDDAGRPNIGEVVNGYQKVIDTHYDADGTIGKGTNPEEWGIERLTSPYYLFTIIQPEGTAADAIDDTNAGEKSGSNFPSGGQGSGGGDDPEVIWEKTVGVKISGGNAIIKYEKIDAPGEETSVEVASGEIFYTDPVAQDGYSLDTVYLTCAVYDDTGLNEVVDLNDMFNAGVPANGVIVTVAVPAVSPDTP